MHEVDPDDESPGSEMDVGPIKACYIDNSWPFMTLCYANLKHGKIPQTVIDPHISENDIMESCVLLEFNSQDPEDNQVRIKCEGRVEYSRLSDIVFQGRKR